MNENKFHGLIPAEEVRKRVIVAGKSERKLGITTAYDRHESRAGKTGRREGQSIGFSKDIKFLHRISFIDYIAERLEGGQFKNRKFIVLDLGGGGGVYADQLKREFGDRVKIFTTGLSKKVARDYRRGAGSDAGLIESVKLPKEYLKWRSILELRHKDAQGRPTEEFDLIINTFGEIPHAIRGGNQDKEQQLAQAYIETIIAKLRPGGLASVYPATDAVLAIMQGVTENHPEITIDIRPVDSVMSRLQIKKLNSVDE